MGCQLDVLHLHVGILTLDIIKTHRNIVITCESTQATHANIFNVKGDMELCADSDRNLLQIHCGTDLADLCPLTAL
jgi:hypothetical protein